MSAACPSEHRPERTNGEMPETTPLQQLKAEFVKTLGHPVRIRVLELLSAKVGLLRDRHEWNFHRIGRYTSQQSHRSADTVGSEPGAPALSWDSGLRAVRGGFDGATFGIADGRRTV